VLTLVEDPQVVEVALQLDDAIWSANAEINNGAGDLDDWMRIKAPMEQARLAFVNAARGQFAPDGRPVTRIIGWSDGPDKQTP
jgi:hypothetical protein